MTEEITDSETRKVPWSYFITALVTPAYPVPHSNPWKGRMSTWAEPERALHQVPQLGHKWIVTQANQNTERWKNTVSENIIKGNSSVLVMEIWIAIARTRNGVELPKKLLNYQLAGQCFHFRRHIKRARTGHVKVNLHLMINAALLTQLTHIINLCLITDEERHTTEC